MLYLPVSVWSTGHGCKARSLPNRLSAGWTQHGGSVSPPQKASQSKQMKDTAFNNALMFTKSDKGFRVLHKTFPQKPNSWPFDHDQTSPKYWIGPMHLSTPPGVVLLMIWLTENSSLLFSLLCPRLLCCFCQNWPGWIIYTTCIWAGRASCREGKGRGGGGKGIGKKGKSIKMDDCKMYWYREVTCSVLKMSFVFCQLEFLASTITLNPFSRISSLKRERGGGGGRGREAGRRERQK